MIDVRDGDIKPVPDFGTRIQSEYLRGVGQIDGRFVLFLDIDRLLSPDELLRITAIDPSPAGCPKPRGGNLSPGGPQPAADRAPEDRRSR